MKSSRSTLPSIETENITSTCWWFQTTRASSTTCSSGTCPLSSLIALNTMAIRTCARTASITSRMRVCLQLTYLIAPSIPSRKYPSPDDPEKNINKFIAFAKTLPVPFVLYANFEAFLVPAEETKERASNTKVHQLHKSSGFAAFASPRFQNLMGKYSRTAAKFRWSSFSSILKIRTATSEASCQTWNRWRL